MKSMKVLFRIFLPIFIVSIIAFGISVAVFDRTDEENNSDGTTIEASESVELGESFSGITIDTAVNKITINKSKDEKTHISYSGSEKFKPKYEIKGDALYITTQSIDFWDWIDFDWFTESGNITISVPDKVYEDIEIDSGASDIEVDGLVSKTLDIYVGAGELTGTAFANEMTLEMGAGSMELENCTENICDSLSIDVSAGQIIVKNYETKEYDIDVSAGSVKAEGLSGTGEIDVSAGEAFVTMLKLDGDIDAQASAGQITIKLPEDSTVKINANISAGDIKTDIGGSTEHLSNGQTREFGTGTTGFTIDADTSAGNINILKK